MSRTHISLDGHWDFFIDPEQSLENLDHASTRREITVPGPWQAQFDDLRDYSGVAWYRRSFAQLRPPTTDRKNREPQNHAEPRTAAHTF